MAVDILAAAYTSVVVDTSVYTADTSAMVDIALPDPVF